MAKSILQKKDGTCFLCRLLEYDGYPKVVEEHHVIFGRGKRKLSEKYGLKVYLCVRHHREGPEAVHKNKGMSDILQWTAQARFEKLYGHEKWMQVFGQNYLPEEEHEKIQEKVEPGFFLLEGDKYEKKLPD